ncbi:MAG: hypothetical protein M3O70_23175 [Actinomycetota bacterium]|nr:hypothetical protein [Actinomycetota bacterium]
MVQFAASERYAATWPPVAFVALTHPTSNMASRAALAVTLLVLAALILGVPLAVALPGGPLALFVTVITTLAIC